MAKCNPNLSLSGHIRAAVGICKDSEAWLYSVLCRRCSFPSDLQLRLSDKEETSCSHWILKTTTLSNQHIVAGSSNEEKLKQESGKS